MKAHKTEHIIKSGSREPDFSAHTYDFNELYWAYVLDMRAVKWDRKAVYDRVGSTSFVDNPNVDTYPR